MKPALMISIFAVLLGLVACTNTGSRKATGYEMQVRYAEITRVRREPLPSVAPIGAIVGGFTGLLLSRNKSVGSQVASGVGGAALGGLATSALEGDRMGYTYELRYADGNVSRFITEKGYLREGDCVSVEQGKHANIRRVASALCEPRPGAATVAKPSPAEAVHVRDATQCQAAKEQLLSAASEEEISAAARKVEIICQY